jgi:hypothetical protein
MIYSFINGNETLYTIQYIGEEFTRLCDKLTDKKYNSSKTRDNIRKMHAEGWINKGHLSDSSDLNETT